LNMQDLTDKATIAKLMNSAKAYDEANALKDKARAKGYIHSLSLYGVLTDTATGKSEYRRLEVMSNIFWTQQIVELIYRFFKGFKPVKTYTIWLYNKDRKALSNVGGYD
jgi:hypothetical protein